MKKIGTALLVSTTLALGGMITSCGGGIGNKSIKSDMDSAAYAIGIVIAAQTQAADLSANALPGDSLDRELFLQGFADAVRRKEGIMTPDSAMAIINAYAEKTVQRIKEKNTKEGEEFLEKNATEEGVKVTDSGIQYRVDSLGTGIQATSATDTVVVHYRGTLLDGTEFDTSYDRGTPATFPLSTVIPGFTEGLQLAPAGSKFTLWIPGHLAYGENVRPGSKIGPNQLLRFDIELIEVHKGSATEDQTAE